MSEVLRVKREVLR